jgi:hypothetical protein
MRVTSSMLADAAQVVRGKLYVLGGGISTITARRLPAVHPQLSLVLLVEVEPHEWDQSLDLRIQLIDEDGANMGIDARGKLRVGAARNRKPGEPSLLPMVSNFVNMRFPEAKGYAFAVDHDGEELTRVPFRLGLAEEKP